MKTHNYIWIIVIILALIFIVPNKIEKKEGSLQTTEGKVLFYDTTGYCNEARNYWVLLKKNNCLGDCILGNSNISSCLGMDTNGKTGYYYSNTNICPTTTKEWQCMYPTPQTCNTPADTNCNGCVSDEEFPIALTNWKNLAGGITDDVFPLSLTKWQNREGC